MAAAVPDGLGGSTWTRAEVAGVRQRSGSLGSLALEEISADSQFLEGPSAFTKKSSRAAENVDRPVRRASIAELQLLPMASAQSTGESEEYSVPMELVQSTGESDEYSGRQCTICFGDENDCPGMPWCNPCRCRGTSRWVHKACIMRWIDEKQKKKGIDSIVQCDQCRYPYRMRVQPPSIVEFIKSSVDSAVDFFSPFGAFALCFGGFFYVSFKVGVVSCSVVAGTEATEQWLDSPFNLVPNIAMTATPLALVGFGMFKWEHFIMRGIIWAWARACHAARAVSRRLAGPKADAALRVAAVVDTNLAVNPVVSAGAVGEPLAPEVDYSRVLVSSLSLPFAAALCGRLLFTNQAWTPLQRSLCGGLAYLAVTGSVNIFCMLRSESRRRSRDIENFAG